jgi:hypothetical protein
VLQSPLKITGRSVCLQRARQMPIPPRARRFTSKLLCAGTMISADGLIWRSKKEGTDQMDDRFTFSVFTIEINGRPTLALQAKRHRDAERLCEHGQLRTKLSTITSHGTPLCDASATMKLRLATAEEAALYRRASQSTEPSSDTHIVYLVDDLDG